jgi:hypothetical protein
MTLPRKEPFGALPIVSCAGRGHRHGPGQTPFRACRVSLKALWCHRTERMTISDPVATLTEPRGGEVVTNFALENLEPNLLLAFRSATYAATVHTMDWTSVLFPWRRISTLVHCSVLSRRKVRPQSDVLLDSSPLFCSLL